LFNLDINGLKEKLYYFEDLGVNTIHLMPLFRSPEGDSDGGYAVSDYQSIRPDLGTMEGLTELSEIMKSKGMILILDFILNHTSGEHEWAIRARAGEKEYQDYYFMFDTHEEADGYDAHLREIFPSVRKGSFTYVEECRKWVWTTFNSFQWDLNYSNPDVFKAMCEQMLFLSNHGADVLRFDALAFTWKEKGTNCENLPKAHILIKALRSVAKVAAPGLTFLSEAIVHPDEVIEYISKEECELSYNPLLMATSWEALATRNTGLLKKTFSPRFAIPEDCRWVNYIRCHDDIGWTFCDKDASLLGINGYDHRRFLNNFYTGRFDGSFASGVPFQENPENGDARISGTLASLAGLEKGLLEKNTHDTDMAVKRIQMMMGFILSLPGLPLLYSGDEIAVLNDYSYMKDEQLSGDSRWVHRNRFPWDLLKNRTVEDPASRVYDFVKKMIRLRSEIEEIQGRMELLNVESSNLIAFKLKKDSGAIVVLINFTERETIVSFNTLRVYGGSHKYKNLLNSALYSTDIEMKSYEVMWLRGEIL
jgi:amylosucrase